jgi:hypothetical protein
MLLSVVTLCYLKVSSAKSGRNNEVSRDCQVLRWVGEPSNADRYPACSIVKNYIEQRAVNL